MQPALKTHPRLRDYFPMALATFFWAMPALFIRYIRRESADEFTPEAMNVFRYGAGALFSAIVVACWRPNDFIPVFRKLWVPAILALSLAVFQAVWVPGVCRVSAPYSTLIGRSTLVFNMLFVYLFFKDERHLIRSRRFLILSSLCLATVAGIILADPAFTLHSASDRTDYAYGTFLLIISALLWSIYTASVRRLAPGLPSAATFAVTAIFCTIFLAPLAWINGSLGFIASPACPGRVIFAVIASGILCIGATQMLFYASLKRIGVVRCSLISLLTPFLTGVLSFMTLGEKLTPLQWTLGAVLITNLAIIIAGSSPKPDPDSAG